MLKLDGYFPLYWDERTGSLWLEIPRFDTDFLYATGLAAGLGSNDIGLDRGQEGGGKIVSFQRVGPKVLLVQGNESFRSSSANPAERRSVEDSFARSVLWGFTVAAESNGRVLVDATDFLLRDGHGAGNQLARRRRLPRRSDAQRLLPAAHQGVPQEHRDRSDADLHQRGRRRRGGGFGAGRPRDRRPSRSRPGAAAAVAGGRLRRRTVLRHRRQRHAHRRGRDSARALFAGRAARR